MKCNINVIGKNKNESLGEPKEIIVDAIPWEKDGESGHTYSYHMSTERFQRKNSKCYEIVVEDGAEHMRLSSIGYYDFVDFDYDDCISERQIQMVAERLGVSSEEVIECIRQPLEELQKEIRQEFLQTEEARVKQEHEKILQTHTKAKRDFTMQYGFSSVDYDRCYNVFGQLMDGEYLGKLQKILHEREEMKFQSKRYRKSESQKKFHQYLHTAKNIDYSEEERAILAKFYKVLAKKYHPDANPQVDTSEEMTLLNKVKKEWNV